MMILEFLRKKLLLEGLSTVNIQTSNVFCLHHSELFAQSKSMVSDFGLGLDSSDCVYIYCVRVH